MYRLCAVILLLLAVCGQPTPTPTPQPAPTVAPTVAPTATPTPAWYAGGTLHDATVAEWRAGTDVDRLATAADWATGGFEVTTVAELERVAPELLACITEGLDGYGEAYGEDAPVLDLAAVCVAKLDTD